MSETRNLLLDGGELLNRCPGLLQVQSFHQKGGEGWQEFQKGATFILQGWVKCCTLKSQN